MGLVLLEVRDQIITHLYIDELEIVEQLFKENEKLINEKLINNNDISLHIRILQIRYHRQKREFDIARVLLSKLEIDIENIQDPTLMFRWIIEHESLIAGLDKYQEVIDNHEFKIERIKYLSQLEEIRLNLTPDQIATLQDEIGVYYNLKGLFSYYFRDMKTSTKFFEKSMSILNKINDAFSYVSSVINCAWSNLYLGNWKQTEALLESAIEISSNLTDQQHRFWVVNGYALLFLFRAEIQKSMSYFKLGIDIAKQLDDPRILADILQTHGVILWEQSYLEKALVNFEEVLTYPHENINKTSLAISLFYSHWINLELGRKQAAENILKQTEIITLHSNDSLFQISYRIGNALKLKYSSSLSDKLKAKEEFQSLKDLKIDNNRLNLILLSLLAEILVMEYRATEEPEILNQIKSLINELRQNGLREGIVSQIIDAYLILSKIALIEGDLITAQDYLIEGIKLSEEKNLVYISKMFSKEYDRLYDAFYNYEGFRIESNMNDIDGFQNLILNIGKHVNINKKINVSREEPILVLIIDKHGRIKHKQSYSPEIDVKFIASVIEKIIALVDGQISLLRYIERTNFQDYHIIVKPHNSVLFCYIFTGDSYHALRKLKMLIENLPMNSNENLAQEEANYLVANYVADQTSIINEIITNQTD